MPEGSEGSSSSGSSDDSNSGGQSSGGSSSGRDGGSRSNSRVSRSGYSAPMRSGSYGWNYMSPRQNYAEESYRYASPEDWREPRQRYERERERERNRESQASPAFRGNGGYGGWMHEPYREFQNYGHDPYSMNRATYGAPPPYGPQGYTQGSYTPQPVFIQPIFADLSGEQQQKESTMSEVKNVFSIPAYTAAPAYAPPAYAAPVAAPVIAGGGLGLGGDGGLLALALLGGGGLFNGGRGNHGDNCDASKAAILSTGFDGVNHNINTSMIGLTNQLNAGFGGQRDLDVMAKLGSIEAAIPVAEAAMQLALAGSTAAITADINASSIANLNGQALIQKSVSEAIAASLASQSAIKESVAAYGTANLNATNQAKFEIVTAVNADGTATRTLINQLNTDNLNRLLTVADLDRRDEVNRGRFRENEITINNSATATAQQVQQQSQSQTQFQLLAQLAAGFHNLTNDVQAIRQGSVVFNSGTMAASGNQSAQNTKVA